MSVKFNQGLIQETIDCFREEDGIVITPEQAEEYLSSFADLFLAFAGESRPRSLEAGGSPAAPSEPPTLGVSNT